jgi:hypothetical protein
MARRRTIAVAVGMVVVFGVALFLWITGSNGSKRADLGSSLASGLVVGVVLLYAQASLNRTNQQGQASTAMGANPAGGEPDEDSPAVEVHPEAAKVEVLVGEVRIDAVSGMEGSPVATHLVQVVYLGWQRDTSRVDAAQVRLRLIKGGDYFQFVSVIMPSPELRRWVADDPQVTRERIWWHVADAAKPAITSAILSREIPKPSPTMAYEVEILGDDLRRAVMAARSDHEHEVVVGREVFTIEYTV